MHSCLELGRRKQKQEKRDQEAGTENSGPPPADMCREGTAGDVWPEFSVQAAWPEQKTDELRKQNPNEEGRNFKNI